MKIKDQQQSLEGKNGVWQPGTGRKEEEDLPLLIWEVYYWIEQHQPTK